MRLSYNEFTALVGVISDNPDIFPINAYGELDRTPNGAVLLTMDFIDNITTEIHDVNVIITGKEYRILGSNATL